MRSHRAARRNARFSNYAAELHANLDSVHELTQTHLRCYGPLRKQCSQKTACARPSPRPSVAGRLSRKRHRPPRGVSRTLHAKGRRRTLRVFLADGCQVALAGLESCKCHFEPGKHCSCENLPPRHAHLSSLCNAPSKSACGGLNVHLRDCPGRRHTWVATAFASRVARQRSDILWRPLIRSGLFLSELRLLLRCPRKQLFILRRLRQEPSGRQHLRTSHQRIFMVLGVGSFQSSKAAVVLHGQSSMFICSSGEVGQV